MFQFTVRPDDSIGVHDQIHGDFADGRELIAFVERARFDGVFHLLDELQVERNTRGWIESKNHKVY